MLNVPVLTAVRDAQRGPIKSGTSFFRVKGGDFSLECLKAAQDGRGCILRLAERSHCRGRAKVIWDLPASAITETNMIEEDKEAVSFENGSFEFDYKPYEVKTFRIRF